jgi:uncharacterized membrane-anchored protein YjiN (DUF445 family)
MPITPIPLAAAVLVFAAGAWWAFARYPRTGEAREAQLAAAKRQAALWLFAAAAAFLATFAAHGVWMARLLRTALEAAMVGATADWLAVAALFRPLPFVSESDLVARQKNAIGDDFADFVKDKFLDPQSLAALIHKHDLAQGVAGWLAGEANARYLAGFIANTLAGALQMLEAERIQALVRHATRSFIAGIDLSHSAADVLDTLTVDGRHQQLLDQLLAKMLDAVNRRTTREAMAAKIVDWLRTQHRIKQMVLPTEWIGDKGSEIIADNLGDYLEEVRDDPRHPLRETFDEQVHALVGRLRTDAVTQAKAEEIKAWLLNDDALGRYASELWASLSGWIRRDLEQPEAQIHRNIATAAAWLGRELASDPELRRTVNVQLEIAARSAAPEFATFLTRHIRETVHQWDARQMSHQVELALGARLQKIRLNGTFMGFLIGLGLFLLGEAAARWLAV